MQTISQRNVLSRRPAAVIGMIASGRNVETHTVLNSDPQRVQISTLTVSNFADGKKYTWTIDGEEDSYTAIAADTNNDGVAAKIAAEINNNQYQRGLVKATAAGAVVTLTGLYPGQSVDVFGSTDLAAADTQSALEASKVPFGRLVIFAGQAITAYEGYSQREMNLNGKLPLASALTARVLTLVPTVVNSTEYSVTAIVDGVRYSASHTSDGSATAQEIVEGLQTALAAVLPSSVVATEDDASLILTGAGGVYFEVEHDSNQALTVTEAGQTLEQVALGVTKRRDDLEVDTIGGGATLEYPANHPMEVITRGLIAVELESGVTPSMTDPVYVGVGASNTGRFYNAAGADRLRLPNHIAKWKYALSSNIGQLFVNLPQ